MMRKLLLSDLRELEGHQNGFPMPDVTNPLYFYQMALIDSETEELLGAVFVKLTAETSLIFKQNVSQLKKAKAYLEMFPVVEKAHEYVGLDDTHIFVLGPDDEVSHYCQVLRNKLGFTDAPGVAMYYKKGARKWLKEQRRIQRDERTRSETVQLKLLLEPCKEEAHSAHQG